MSEAVLSFVPDGLLLDDGREKMTLPDTVETLEVAIKGYQSRAIRTAFMSPTFDADGATQLALARYNAAIEVLELRKADLEGVQNV